MATMKRILSAFIVLFVLATASLAATEALQIDALWSGLNNPTNGKSYSGAIVATFASGTSTAKAVWEDKEKTLPSSLGKAQFTLDSNGQAFVYGDGVYKISVYAPTDTGLTSPLMTIDGATYLNPTDGSIIGVSSIAVLRAGSGGDADNQKITILGYYTPGDGGGQDLYWGASSTATDNGVTIFKASATTGRWKSVNPDTYTLKQAGCKIDGITDDTARFQAAIDAAPTTGARITKDPGIMVLTSTVTIDKGGIILEGGARGGKMQGGLGSYITPGSAIVGDLIRVEGSSTISGVTIRDLAFFGDNSRTYGINSAIHVENCDNFSAENLQFQSIKGQAIKTVRCVKANFININIIFSGDTGKPVLETAGTSTSLNTQNSTFTNLKIEFCYSDPYMKIGQYDVANKFFGVGFEGSIEAATYDFTYLQLIGSRNDFHGVSLNQNGITSTVQKVKVEGSYNKFIGVQCNGDRFDATSYDFIVTGQSNIITDVAISGLAATTDTYFAKLDTGSNYSIISNVTSDKSGGIIVSAPHTKILNSIFVSCDTTYGVSLESATRQVLVSGVEFFSQGTSLTHNFLDNGAYNKITGCQIIGNASSTHTGLKATSASGSYTDNYFLTIGGHGMHFSEGTPRNVNNNVIIDPGSNAATTYHGIFYDLTSGANTVGGTIVGNTIVSPLSTPIYSIAINDMIGTARHQYLIITGNRAEDGIRNGDGSITAYNNIVGDNT